MEKKTIIGFTKANLLYSKYNSTKGINECRYFESKHHEDLDTDSYHFYRLIAFKLVFIIVYQVNIYTKIDCFKF